MIDHFSKYVENFLINKKDETTVINKIKLFIQNNGKPDKILTDNGKEYTNKKIRNFCKKNNRQWIIQSNFCINLYQFV